MLSVLYVARFGVNEKNDADHRYDDDGHHQRIERDAFSDRDENNHPRDDARVSEAKRDDIDDSDNEERQRR